jgi:predicted esterase
MLSLQIAASSEQKLAGIVCFSGTLIPYKSFNGNTKTPICFIYGLQDEVLSPESMQQSAAELTQIGFQVTSHPIANLMHSIDAQGINIANNFILQQL